MEQFLIFSPDFCSQELLIFFTLISQELDFCLTELPFSLSFQFPDRYSYLTAPQPGFIFLQLCFYLFELSITCIVFLSLTAAFSSVRASHHFDSACISISQSCIFSAKVSHHLAPACIFYLSELYFYLIEIPTTLF